MSLRSFASLAALFICVGCKGYRERPPVFPENESRWAIPLHEPLTRRNPFVWAEMQGVAPADGAAPPTLTALLLVDSGSWTNCLDAAMFQRLGVELESDSSILSIDAAGRKRPWQGGVVPRMRLGGLELRDNLFALIAEHGLLGRNMLDAYPWEIDLDRGVFVVGAAPYTGADAATLSMTRRDRGHYVEVHLGDEHLLMEFDTGASFTAVDDGVAREAKFERVPLKVPKVMSQVFGKTRVEAIYAAEVAFGGVHGGKVPLVPIKMERGGALNQKVVGLFGFDAMARFRFRVEPGDVVQFRPRADLLATARARIERWPWVPRCADAPGCATAEARPDGDDLALKFTYHGAYDAPVAFLFACVDASGHVDHDLDFIRVSRARAAAGEADEVRFGPVEPADRAWLERARGRCDRVALLDVNHLRPGEPAPERPAFGYARSVLASTFDR